MIGFHVTNLENLDSILELGILPCDTTKNHFPMAWDNRYERVFFMANLNSANLWAECHHKWTFNGKSKSNRCYADDEMVIVEFNSPISYEDSYAYSETNYMKDSRYTEKVVSPAFILDIHSVTKGEW